MYEVQFSDETGTEVAIPDKETTLVVTGDVITTIMVGDDTFTVIYDEEGNVAGVESARRRTDTLTFAERRLASCEESCAAESNQLCGALTVGCNDPTGTLATLLGDFCDDVADLCDETGILAGCDRTCAPCECGTSISDTHGQNILYTL